MVYTIGYVPSLSFVAGVSMFYVKFQIATAAWNVLGGATTLRSAQDMTKTQLQDRGILNQEDEIEWQKEDPLWRGYAPARNIHIEIKESSLPNLIRT